MRKAFLLLALLSPLLLGAGGGGSLVTTFSSSTGGTVPAAGACSEDTFLRCDGTWAIPAGGGGGGGGITSLGGLSGATQTFATPNLVTGTAPSWSSSGTAHTLRIPMASAASVTAGLLSKTDYDAFAAKQAAITGSAHGDIAFYDGSSWVRLAPGTSGQYLKTLGSGADPAWDTPAGGGGGGGVDTLAAVGSSPNANGATISGTTLNLQPASASHPGVVTTGTQSFAGAKTFGANVNVTPTGTFIVGGVNEVPGLGFVGNGLLGNTGFLAQNHATLTGGVDMLAVLVGGNRAATFQANSPYPHFVSGGPIRLDAGVAAGSRLLGLTTSYFDTGYIKQTIFNDGNTNTAPFQSQTGWISFEMNSTSYIHHGMCGVLSGGSGNVCLNFDRAVITGRDWTIAPSANAVNDTSAGSNLTIKSGGKTASTGASGTFTIASGNSSGGVAGDLILEGGTGSTAANAANILFKTNGTTRMSIDNDTGRIGVQGATLASGKASIYPLTANDGTGIGLGVSGATPIHTWVFGGAEAANLVYSSNALYIGQANASQSIVFQPGAIAASALTMSSTGTYVFGNTGGAVGSPAFTFLGDTNTGIYRPAADEVGVSTGGTKRMHFRASGVIGVTLTDYADDTAAGAGGLVAGDLYQTSGTVKVKL